MQTIYVNDVHKSGMQLLQEDEQAGDKEGGLK